MIGSLDNLLRSNITERHLYNIDPGTGNATELADFGNDISILGLGDLGYRSERDFDVTYISAYNQEGQTAEGASNGIGWSICSTWFSCCCGANTDGTYQGFDTDNFYPPIANEDDLHITSRDFSIVFDQLIDSIVFYLLENGGNASLDFGLEAEVVSGGDHFTITSLFMLKALPRMETQAVRAIRRQLPSVKMSR